MVGSSSSSSLSSKQQSIVVSSSSSSSFFNYLDYRTFLVIVSSGIAIVESILLLQQYYYHRNQQQQEQQQTDKKKNKEQEEEQHEQQNESSLIILSKKCIYLDYNGTTPIYKEIYNSMEPYFIYYYGNPSSKHHYYGQQPYYGIENARKQILYMLGIDVTNTNTKTSSLSSKSTSIPSIIFTGCGTEANNFAISLAIQKYYNHHHTKKRDGTIPHIVTTNIEHPAIEQCLKYYEQQKNMCTVTYVPVQPDGRVLAKDIITAIRLNNETALVTIMYANNESGAIQPVQEIAQYCYNNNILMHIDAAQAVGKVSMDAITTLGNPAMITIVGHKIGAPKGIACLYIRNGSLENNNNNNNKQPYQYHGLLLGGGQENGLRAGTENVPYIVALGKACEICTNQWESNNIYMESLRNLLITELYNLIPNNSNNEILRINGPTDPNQRLPNTLSIGIRGIHSGILLTSIGQDVAASAGAACHSVVTHDNNNNNDSNDDTSSSVSSVLRAMHVPLEYAKGTIRLSVGPTTTETEIRTAAQIIASAVQKQQLVALSSSNNTTITSTTTTTTESPPILTSIHGSSTTTTTTLSSSATTTNATTMNNKFSDPIIEFDC